MAKLDLTSVIQKSWAGWCEEGTSDKVYASVYVVYNGLGATFNLWKARKAVAWTVKIFTGNKVQVAIDNKASRYNHSIPLANMRQLEDELTRQIVQYYVIPSGTPSVPTVKIHAMDGEYYLWKCLSADISDYGFDKGIQYYSEESGSGAGKGLIRVMNRYGDWKLVNVCNFEPVIDFTN